jgi:predicted nucleic acid-binding protein
MIEFIFVLSKLNQLLEQQRTVSFFQQFVKGQIEGDLIMSAYQLCTQHKQGKNINDFIHLKFAEKHCEKIITFDTDFKVLQAFSSTISTLGGLPQAKRVGLIPLLHPY